MPETIKHSLSSSCSPPLTSPIRTCLSPFLFPVALLYNSGYITDKVSLIQLVLHTISWQALCILCLYERGADIGIEEKGRDSESFFFYVCTAQTIKFPDTTLVHISTCYSRCNILNYSGHSIHEHVQASKTVHKKDRCHIAYGVP